MRTMDYFRQLRLCLNLLRMLAVLVALTLVTEYSHASDPNAPKYDTQTETKMKGTIEDIMLPPSGHEKEIVHLLMKNGADAINVYLCPKSFLDDMGVTFSKGDEITVTGSKVKQDGADLVLAKQTEKGNDTLVLRDDKGAPVWAWSSKK